MAKHRFKPHEEPDTLPEAAAQPAIQSPSVPSEIESDLKPEAVTEAALTSTKDFEWDCGDTRYNIGDKVFKTGDRLSRIPIDEDGSPSNPALKKAFEHKFLKAEKTNSENKED